MTIFFSLLLHIYQPPTQLPFVVKQIAEECYRPLIQTLKKFPNAKIVLNCNAILTEQLYDLALDDVINGFSELADRNQLEFTNSAKFHAILPLIPPIEIKRQIELNDSTNRHFFGNNYRPEGFFPPEMAVDSIILDPIKETGHNWFIMSGVGNPNPIFPTTTFFNTKNGLKVVFRDDSISNDISFDRLDADGLLNRLKYNEHINRDYYVILAQDGETYGHHIKHLFNKLLIPILDKLDRRQDIKIVTISELMNKFLSDATIIPKPSSWSTSGEDLKWQNPLTLWYDPDNPIHLLQHNIIMKVTSLVITAEQHLNEASDHEKHLWQVARSYLDRGSHSCQQWWASKKPWYSPDMIIKGLHELVISAVNAKRSISEKNIDLRNTFTNALHEILEIEMNLIEQLD
ncbi:MAG: Alpha-amylase 1 [Candidatus Heimdallarchaeota archaeon LC_3]|nr:MAG: Alpha-amylase 1 [Candidatus Heimdallarchaeota archaeon LC_3]